MPSKAQHKRNQELPKLTYHAQPIPYTAVRIKELPYLTFTGKTLGEATRNARAELARQNPQGFELEFSTFPDPTYDRAMQALEHEESRH